MPCSGAINLATMGLLVAQATYLTGVGCLVLYNVISVAPLVVMLAAAESRVVVDRLGRRQLHHRAALKTSLGVTTVGLGLVLLETFYAATDGRSSSERVPCEPGPLRPPERGILSEPSGRPQGALSSGLHRKDIKYRCAG